MAMNARYFLVLPVAFIGFFGQVASAAVPAGETRAELGCVVHGDGVIEAKATLKPKGKLPEIPRLGMMCQLPGRDTIRVWFVRGPGGNYRDRQQGYPAGIWSGKAAGDSLLEMGAYAFLHGDLEGPPHPLDIPERSITTVHVGPGQTGVGGEISRGGRPLAKYEFPADKGYSWQSRILPVSPP
jgi:beta-galactosidase